MNTLKLNQSAKSKIAIVLKEVDVVSTNQTKLVSNYVKPLMVKGFKDLGSIVFIGLPYPLNKNITKSFATEHVDKLLEYCDTQGINTIMVADSKYFEFLVPGNKCEASIGHKLKVAKVGYEHITILPSLHYNVLHFNPDKAKVIDHSMKVLVDVLSGTYAEPGTAVIQSTEKVLDSSGISKAVAKLKSYNRLAIDIETTGLRFETCDILTVAFSPDTISGIGIAVDKRYHSLNDEQIIKKELKDFFTYAKDNIQMIFHNGLFDIKFLVRHLFMQHDDDFTGMKGGLEVFGKVDDSMLVAYLATNSTVRNPIGLKELSAEYLGKYAIDAKDCTVFSIDELLEYNIADVIGTNYVYDKYYRLMIDEQQDIPYNTIFQPSMKPLLAMMMTGLPLDTNKVHKSREDLYKVVDDAMEIVKSSKHVKRTINIIVDELVSKYNSAHKKQKTVDDFCDTEFNPGSSTQLRILLIDVMGFGVIETTDTGLPSVGGVVIDDYISQSETNGDVDAVELLKAIRDIGSADKVNGTFLKAFENLGHKHDKSGLTFLNGNLRMGGVISGRLSSNSPNLQNLPSGSTYGKLIKSCFVAPVGWLFCGADFSALEDKIGAILSKDKNKTLEFSQGADGHCLRAAAFFPEELPPIDITDVEQVNSIKKSHPDIRQKAKGPSFALQYSGTWVTIKRTLGCTEEKAKQIEASYHELYSGLSDFAKSNEEHARRHGFVNCAFGMRLRTPILERAGRGNNDANREAGAEARSSNNATTQSWGMLMNRTFIELYDKINKSKYCNDIRLINTIHDAVYILCRDDAEVVQWLNTEVVKSMEWQEHPLLKSDEVKLGAELDIGKSWDKQHTLKNNATLEEVQEFLSGVVHKE